MGAPPGSGLAPDVTTTHGAEVVVVGSGLSGLEASVSLLQHGARDVLVLEGGSADAATLEGASNGVGGASAAGLAPQRSRTSDLPPHYDQDPFGPARVGGRSLRWHGVVLRLEDWALDDPHWPAPVRGALRGSGQDEAGLYAQVESDLQAWQRHTAEISFDDADATFVALLAEVLPGPVQTVPQAVRRWRAGTQDHWRAYTPLDLWREQVGEPGVPDRTPAILPDAEALAVLTAGGRVTGVRVRHASTRAVSTIACSRVLLAAGTLENTRLIAQLQARRGAGDADARFTGLNDHLTQGFVASVPAAALPPVLRAGAFALLARDRQHRCNLFARLHPAPDGAESLLLDVWAMSEQERSSASSVAYLKRQHLPWTAHVHPGLSPADEAVLTGGRILLDAVWARLGERLGVPVAPLHFPDFLHTPRPFENAYHAASTDSSQRPWTYTWPLGASDHEGGTLPLGEVLDDTGQLRTVRGVFVVGPATFPRAGAANPSLTTLALARYTARALAAG
ncbi:MAG: GMC family oxidoreductase [Chloroflexi bacterium]|nr:GMC family oxidoreductase [Chloroflexota bacterium]